MKQPAEQAPPVQKEDPSHTIPSWAFLQELVEVDGSQERQGLAGSIPGAEKPPSMKQPVVHAPLLQTSVLSQLVPSPLTGDQNVVLSSGTHARQVFDGSIDPGE